MSQGQGRCPQPVGHPRPPQNPKGSGSAVTSWSCSTSRPQTDSGDPSQGVGTPPKAGSGGQGGQCVPTRTVPGWRGDSQPCSTEWHRGSGSSWDQTPGSHRGTPGGQGPVPPSRGTMRTGMGTNIWDVWSWDVQPRSVGSDRGCLGILLLPKIPAWRREPFCALWAQWDGIWDLGQLSPMGGMCWGHEIQDWGGAEPFTSPERAFWVLILPLLPPQSSVIPLWQGPAHCSVTWALYFHRDFPPSLTTSRYCLSFPVLLTAGKLQIPPLQH